MSLEPDFSPFAGPDQVSRLVPGVKLFLRVAFLARLTFSLIIDFRQGPTAKHAQQLILNAACVFFVAHLHFDRLMHSCYVISIITRSFSRKQPPQFARYEPLFTLLILW